MQCLLNEGRLRLQWQQRKSWMSLQDYLIVQDKQSMQYLSTLE